MLNNEILNRVREAQEVLPQDSASQIEEQKFPAEEDEYPI
jgi:hypothetical protein